MNQMNKKWLVICLCVVLSGCATQVKIPANRDFSGQMEVDAMPFRKTKTAMLLPLSGQTATVGENFQNAALVAGLERPTEATEVLFFDTKGTANGAIDAYHQALTEKPDIFVGPVFASEVEAIKQQEPNKPVLSFTSDTTVLGNNIYSLALLIPQQIQRIVDFACSRGQRRFAVLGPQDKTAEIVVRSFEKAVESCPGMQIVDMSFYDVNSANLTTPVAQIAPPLLDAKKKDLTETEKELLKNPTAERLKFDALFVFEQGVKLQQLVSILYYYDITPQIVPFYGLATLRQSNNPQLVGSYFADMSQERLEVFKSKYVQTFEKKPLPVAAFGYDAVALISFLSQQNALTSDALTDDAGYQGVNGRFRLKEDGTNERLLEIYQVISKNRSVVVENAPSSF